MAKFLPCSGLTRRVPSLCLRGITGMDRRGCCRWRWWSRRGWESRGKHRIGLGYTTLINGVEVNVLIHAVFELPSEAISSSL